MLTSTASVPEIEVEALEAHCLDALVLDVREPAEYDHGHVPGSINLPQADLASRLDELPRDRPVYVLCQGGFRSLRAARFLNQMGFEQVASVKGGTAAWSAAGKPLVGEDAPLDEPRVAESEWTHAGALSYAI
jgi:rhodanese-related sulfurtransferase